MRSRVPALIAALSVSLLPVRASDTIAWVRANGEPGWTAALSTGPPQGASSTALAAPVWFARFPEAKIPLAPEGAFELSSARGKILLLDYWASWCGPCLQELPHLQKLHTERSGAGLVALAVNTDEGATPTWAADAAKRLGLTMQIGVNNPEVSRTLGVRTLPTLLIVDRSGRLRARWDGYRPGLEREIAKKVDDLLADDAAGTTREVARVITGPAKLEARWSRDLSGTAEGVVGLPSGTAGAMRVVASGGNELISYDAAGEAIARLRVDNGMGRVS